MIDKVDTHPDPNTEKIFASIQRKALGVIYVATEPTSAKVPDGKLVIYDNGTTREGYLRTGKGTVVKWTLTAI